MNIRSNAHMIRAFGMRNTDPVASFSDPTSVPNLAAWYTARDATTITVNVSNIVTEWADKSGLGNHATASAFVNPIYDGTKTINSIAVPTFDNAGANDCGLNLPLGLIRNLAGCTMISVAAATSAGTRTLYGFGFDTFSTGTWQNLSADGVTGFVGGKKRVAADADQTVTGGDATAASLFILTQWTDWQNTTMRVRVNGVQVAESIAYQATGNSADVAAGQAFLGMDSYDAVSWRERIGEWMLYQRALDATEIADIEGLMATEWGITI